MRRTLIFLLAASVAGGADSLVQARGLQASSFADDDGRLLRKFTAQSAVGPFLSPVVENGKVEFFGKDSASRTVAVVEWAQAKYLRTDEVIVGDGSIQLSTDDGVVSGRGFRCGLETGRLDLQSEVKFSSGAFRMSGDGARIEFEAKGGRKRDVIQVIAVTGNIMVVRAATAKAPFDRAECSFARFSAAENKVFLKTPITAWRNGEKSLIDVASGFVEIDLGEKTPNPSPPPTRTEGPRG